jgi:hypothetical protein
VVDCPALPSPFKLTTLAFPSMYATPMSAHPKLQKALDDALAVAIRRYPSIANMGIALVALDNPGAHAMAHQNGDIVYFGASMIKIAALYGVYELRTTLRAIAAELGCNTSTNELLKQAARHLDPQIIDYTKKKLPALAGIARTHTVPKYDMAFHVVARPDKTFTVDFRDAFAPRPLTEGTYQPKGHVEAMIAVSNNYSAGQCVHACGYGYLEGALAEGGHFEPRTGQKGVGIWLGGDYISDFLPPEKAGDKRKPNPASYPTYQIEFAEGHTSQGSTALHCARLLTLLADKQLFGGNPDANEGMLDVMTKAVISGEVYVTRKSRDLHFKVLQTKLGHFPLKGTERYSECSILEHDSGKRFVLVWLNLLWGDEPYDELDAFSHAIRDAMEAYLAP